MSSMRKETIFFIFSPVSSSTGLSKIGIKIYKLHEQTNKKERQGRRERRREGGRERESVENSFGLQICRGGVNAKFNRILSLQTPNPRPPSSNPGSDGRV